MANILKVTIKDEVTYAVRQGKTIDVEDLPDGSTIEKIGRYATNIPTNDYPPEKLRKKVSEETSIYKKRIKDLEKRVKRLNDLEKKLSD